MRKIKVTTVGGGTGSYMTLSALKEIPNLDISAVVAMTDNGGSTGTLRDELGVLPPGDVRQCLTALSEETEIVRKLMSYRFDGGTLDGFSFGSIFLAGLEKVSGSFVNGLETASRLLKTAGKVIPIVTEPATLIAHLQSGKQIIEEYNIYDYHLEEDKIQNVLIRENLQINKDAQDRIIDSDFVIIGPGDIYCSILPNLMVNGFSEAIQKTNAKIIYIVNLTNRRGHTLNWSIKKYIEKIEGTLGRKIDIILANKKEIDTVKSEKYLAQEGLGVVVENDILDDSRLITADILSEQDVVKSYKDPNKSFIRHDSKKVREVLGKIIYENTN